MLAILNFIYNKMLSYTSGHTAKSGIPRKLTAYTELVKLFLIYQHLHYLDFTRNQITNVRSGHTPMSHMLGNPMVHTKIMILL